MAMYQTFNGVNRRLQAPIVGIDGVTRTCDKGFVGIDGKRCQFFGILEGVTRCVFVVHSCAAGDTVENTDPNSDVQYTVINEVEGMNAVNQVGSISTGIDSSGKLFVDMHEHVSGKSISLTAYLELEFDNARTARIYRVFQHYIAPVRIPIQAEVASENSPGASGLKTGHGVYVGNQSAWEKGQLGLGPVKYFDNTQLEHDAFQVICGIRSGSGTTQTKMILPDGIYVDNKRVPLVIRNNVN